MEFYANWGHAPAQQPKRVSVDSERDNVHLATNADEVLGRRHVRRAAGTQRRN